MAETEAAILPGRALGLQSREAGPPQVCMSLWGGVRLTDTVPCKRKRPHQHQRQYPGHTAKSSSWSQPRGTHRPNRTTEEYPWGGVLPVGLSVVRALGARIKLRGSKCILPVFHSCLACPNTCEVGPFASFHLRACHIPL